MTEVPRGWLKKGRLLTIEQLEAADCCSAGRMRFLRRYGPWVVIDDDWAKLEWRVWKTFDLWWLCRPWLSIRGLTPLLSPWAGKLFMDYCERRECKIVGDYDPAMIAYFASIYVDDGRILDAEAGR